MESVGRLAGGIAHDFNDLNETIEGMLRMLRRLIGEDIHLSWRPFSHIWTVKADPAQVDQIMANLCANARDGIQGVGKVAIETANVTLDKTYCMIHEGVSPGDYVCIAVSDTGLGSTFKVYLPRYNETAGPMHEHAELRKEQRGNETILLVEDEEAILRMTSLILEKLGYTVLSAAGPRLALSMAESYTGTIDLLMTDVVMPEMSGRDLANGSMASLPHLKVLYC